MSLKSPKTPGGPLKDLSWLQNSMQDPSVAPLVVELARLHQELDRANASIDDKLDRLEDAGMGVVDLTKQLEDARTEVVGLEDDLARMSRREDRRIRRLQRLRCQKCRTKIDMRGLDSTGDADESSFLEASTMSMSLAEPPTPPSRTSEALRSEIREVNAQLDDMKHTWEVERKKLLGENAVLQDAATRLNAEMRDAKDEIRKYASAERAGERARAGIQDELARAKRTTEELEAELKAERSRLRALTSEQTKAQREKEAVRLDLRRTESDMSDVRQQLQQIKQENHDLERELRSNANAEQKARLLEAKVAENLENIDQLRQERSMLAADHKELQRRYAKAAEEVTRLKGEFAASQTSHDTRRHELDLRTLEIDDLRRALAGQASELERAAAERARMAAEKGDVARTVAALEADLRRVRRDAEAFGRDLKALRAQKDRMEEDRTKAERAQKQAQAQIRVLREELDGQREKVREAREQWRGHVCAADDQQLVTLKQQHNRECKGLMVQIKYLKAKYTRESAFRCDLGYQKQYLLGLMARLERSEEKILAAVARIGFPALLPNPAPKKRRTKTLRSVAYIVLFLNRTRRASEQWKQHRASKPAIEAALQDVRKRRLANGTGTTSATAQTSNGRRSSGSHPVKT
uniref:Lid2 complex component lid2 n=1 Tax=Ganoderma boninense TaxID=34458 RepID=A0A5K1K990_9APHY|nr:Lid2 complex component lid2 [Ganoderma boninense]